MIKRLGFSGRLIVIVLLVLFAAVALGTGSSFVARSRNTGMSPRLPLPDQAAAIVALLDKASPEQRVTALRAVNTELLSVAIVDQRPSFGDRRERMAAVEWLVGQYLETLGDREVIAAIETLPGGSGWQDRLNQLRIGQSWLFSPTPLRIAVALDGGGYVVFETRGAIGPRFLGLPAGFGIGVLGALLGLIALLAVIREARPIEALSRSMRQRR